MTPNAIKKQIAGRVLREFIDKHFASYKDFAETIGTKTPTLQGWMSGRTATPVWVIEKLGELFPDDIQTFRKILPDLF